MMHSLEELIFARSSSLLRTFPDPQLLLVSFSSLSALEYVRQDSLVDIRMPQH